MAEEVQKLDDSAPADLVAGSERGKRRRGAWLLKLGLSAAILYLVFREIPTAEIRQSLLAADPTWLAAGLLLSIPILWLAAAQLSLLLAALDTPISAGSILHITLTTEFYALFLPGYLAGGALRWYRLSQRGAPAVSTLAALVFNRLVDITLTSALGFLFCRLAPDARQHTVLSSLMAGVFLASLGLHIVLFQPRLARRLRTIAGTRSRGGVSGWLLGRLAEMAAAGEILGGMRGVKRLSIYLLCLVRHMTGIAALWALAVSIGLETSAVELAAARSVMLLAMLLPISFAGLGLREGGLIVALGLFGVSSGAAAALAILVFLRDLLIRLTGGLLEAVGWLTGRRPASSLTPSSSRSER